MEKLNVTMKDYILETPKAVLENIHRSKELTHPLVDAFTKKAYKRIIVVASGSSCNATHLARLFMMKYLDMEVKVVTPFTFTNYEYNVTDEDFVFCISQSGCSTNTIKALRKCKELGIQAIGLTGNVESDFKTEADLVVDYGVGIEYVGYVTKLYRKYINAFYNKENIEVTEEEIKILKVLYNREFTTGHLFNDEIMNSKTPNHIGYKIGIIKEVKKRLKILLLDDIKQGDAIRFYNNNLGMYLNFIYDEKGNLINGGKKGEIIYIDNKVDLKDKDEVYITYSKQLEDVLKHVKKIPIEFNVNAKINQSLEIEIKDDLNNKILYKGNKVESSTNTPTTKDVIKEKLGKIKDTPFYLKNISIIMDKNIFLPMSEINNIRRELIQKLIEARENKKTEIIINKYEKKIENIITSINEIKIINEEQKYNSFETFYTENEELYKKINTTKIFILFYQEFSIIKNIIMNI